MKQSNILSSLLLPSILAAISLVGSPSCSNSNQTGSGGNPAQGIYELCQAYSRQRCDISLTEGECIDLEKQTAGNCLGFYGAYEHCRAMNGHAECKQISDTGSTTVEWVMDFPQACSQQRAQFEACISQSGNSHGGGLEKICSEMSRLHCDESISKSECLDLLSPKDNPCQSAYEVYTECVAQHGSATCTETGSSGTTRPSWQMQDQHACQREETAYEECLSQQQEGALAQMCDEISRLHCDKNQTKEECLEANAPEKVSPPECRNEYLRMVDCLKEHGHAECKPEGTGARTYAAWKVDGDTACKSELESYLDCTSSH